MELRFLGRGSAFFAEEGNTSAYFIEGKTLFLIDCGESVFGRILQLDLLRQNHIEEIYCFITHMHSDHVGSLGSLILYCTFGEIERRIAFHLVCPSILNMELFPMLRYQGCFGFFEYVVPETLDEIYQSFTKVRFIRTTHQGVFPAFSIEFETCDGKVFYSGDTKELDLIQEYVNQEAVIERMYIEATTLDYSDNVHLPLKGLDEVIPKGIRHKTYLMHFNNAKCITRARELGFQIVECVE